MGIVTMDHGREKCGAEVDREIRELDRNSIGRRECGPVVSRHGRHVAPFLNDKRTGPVWGRVNSTWYLWELQRRRSTKMRQESMYDEDVMGNTLVAK